MTSSGTRGMASASARSSDTLTRTTVPSPAGPLTLHPTAAVRLEIWIVGAVVLAGGAAFALRSFGSDGRSDRGPAVATLAVYGGGLLIAGGLLYPTLVPPGITVHAAASPHSSLLFLMVGVGAAIPIILTYQAYGYWVFRGKLTRRQEATTA